eukprot:3056023-Amphidinium_carterae.1
MMIRDHWCSRQSKLATVTCTALDAKSQSRWLSMPASRNVASARNGVENCVHCLQAGGTGVVSRQAGDILTQHFSSSGASPVGLMRTMQSAAVWGVQALGKSFGIVQTS